MAALAVRLRYVLLVVVLVLLQGTLASSLTVFGVHPDLMLALVVATALTGGRSRGALFGFGIGLLSDLFVDTPFGLSALSDVLVGYGLGMFSAEADASWWLRPVLAGVASAFGEVIFAFLGAIVGDTHLLGPELWKIALVVGGFNALLIIPLWRVVNWALLNRREPNVDRLWR